MSRIRLCPEAKLARAISRGEVVRVIGLDPAQSFGFSVLEIEGQKFILKSSGTWRLNKGMQHCSRGMILIRLGQMLEPMIRHNQQWPMIVAYESARFFKSICQAQSGASIGAHVQFICEQLEVPFVNLEPSEVKKWAGGKGNASKADIRVAMISVFGKWLQTGSRTEDEFDAIAAALAQARKAGWLR